MAPAPRAELEVEAVFVEAADEFGERPLGSGGGADGVDAEEDAGFAHVRSLRSGMICHSIAAEMAAGINFGSV